MDHPDRGGAGQPESGYGNTGRNIRRLVSESEAAACARMMSESEPWLTIGRSYERSLSIIKDPSREVWVVEDDGGLAGFIILCLTGALIGYIQTICIDPRHRGTGVGTELMRFAEERISTVSPNVFLCVSSFNPGARRLYERLGYEYVGELKDYIIEGESELLYRKTLGPWNDFVPAE